MVIRYILIKWIKQNKLSTNFSPEPMKVNQIQGSQVTAERLNDKKVFTRNMCFFKKLHNFNDNIKKDPQTVRLIYIITVFQPHPM